MTVASPVSLEVIVSTTSETGSASKTTVNVSVFPDSATLVEPPVSAIEKPATSSSVVATETVWAETESKSSSDAASITAIVMIVDCVPSIRSSSIPVTVTV